MIEDIISKTVEEAVQKTLERVVPELLRRIPSEPSDPDKTYTYEQAAQFCGVPLTTIQARIDQGSLKVVSVGKYKRILHKHLIQMLNANVAEGNQE